MQFVWGSASEPELNKALAGWLAAHIDGVDAFDEPYTTLGMFNDGQVVAVVLFNNYQPNAGVLEMHAASESKRWLTRPSLKEMFTYPFDQLRCQMVVLRVSERDTSLHRILEAYGFEKYLIPRLRGRNEGEYLFTLTEEAWRSNGFHREHKINLAG